MAGPNEWQQVCNWSNPEETSRSCEGAGLSWLSSKVSRTVVLPDYRWNHGDAFAHTVLCLYWQSWLLSIKGAAFAHIVHLPTILIFFNLRRCQAIPIAIVYANWNWKLNMGLLGMHFLPMILHHLLAVPDPLHSDPLLLSLFLKFYIFTNTKFKHVTSTYYHCWYLVFDFTFTVTFIGVLSCLSHHKTRPTMFVHLLGLQNHILGHWPPRLWSACISCKFNGRGREIYWYGSCVLCCWMMKRLKEGALN